MGSRRRVAALVAALLLSGCAAPAMDAEQAAQERRTCASLRERVGARAVVRFGILAAGAGGEDGKADVLDPRLLTRDPDRFYATLEQELADTPFGAVPEPTSTSPASRLVDTCRSLGS